MKENFNRKIAHICLIRGILGSVFLALLANVSNGRAAEEKINTAKIEQLTSIKGELNEKEGVF